MDDLYRQKVLAGDRDAFRYFVSQYKDFAFSLSFSILKNRHLSEEAIQESFVKAFENLQSFKQESTFKTWFGRIVINESLKMAKKGNHERVPVTEIPDNQVRSIESTISSLVQKEQKYYISAAFEQLSSRESLALELFYLKEHSIREIKEMTGWSDSKIKMLLVRGPKKFLCEVNRNAQIRKEGDIMMDRDKNFRAMLQKKETPGLSDDFENRTMAKVYRSDTSKSRERRYIRLIYVFFSLGLILGFVISTLYVDNEIILFGLNLSTHTFLLQIPLALVIIWLFEKVYRIILFQKGKEDVYDI